MTARGREKAVQIAPELKVQGYDLGVGTLSRQPLRFKATKVLPKPFSKTYTIDTLLGRWCPRSVWEVVGQRHGARRCLPPVYQRLQAAD